MPASSRRALARHRRAQTGRLRSVGNAASAWSGRRPAPPWIWQTRP